MRRRLRRSKRRIWRWGSYRSSDGTLPTIRSVSCKTIILYFFYRCLNRISYPEIIASKLFLFHVHHLLWGSCLPLTNPGRSPALAPPRTNQRSSGGFCKPTCQSRLGKPGNTLQAALLQVLIPSTTNLSSTPNEGAHGLNVSYPVSFAGWCKSRLAGSINSKRSGFHVLIQPGYSTVCPPGDIRASCTSPGELSTRNRNWPKLLRVVRKDRSPDTCFSCSLTPP